MTNENASPPQPPPFSVTSPFPLPYLCVRTKACTNSTIKSFWCLFIERVIEGCLHFVGHWTWATLRLCLSLASCSSYSVSDKMPQQQQQFCCLFVLPRHDAILSWSSFYFAVWSAAKVQHDLLHKRCASADATTGPSDRAEHRAFFIVVRASLNETIEDEDWSYFVSLTLAYFLPFITWKQSALLLLSAWLGRIIIMMSRFLFFVGRKQQL